MKRLLYIAIVSLVIGSPVTALAQMADKAEVKEVVDKYDLGLTKQPSMSFLDLSRLNLSHSYSIGYFSGSGYSGTQAYYNGMLQYQIASPLTLTLNLGVLHDPGALFGDKKFSDNATFLPSGWIDWKPSKNFMMSLGFETIPASSYYNRGYYPYPGRAGYWQDR